MPLTYLRAATDMPCQPLPFYADKVPAGFPSPAQDYAEQALDLNQLCIRHPAATFFVRVSGDSMVHAGISHDDILVVDRSIEARHGDIVVATVHNEFTVKELCTRPQLALLPHNSRYKPIMISNEHELAIFGVVTTIVRQLKRR